MKALKSIANFLKGNSHDTVSDNLSLYTHLPQLVDEFRIKLKSFSNIELQSSISSIRERARTEDQNQYLVETFAIISEAFQRKMGISVYPEQLIAAAAMADRNIVEMQTGEGKTIAAVFTASLEAVSGKQVHILTFNDYLAERDANWMRKVYEFLGLSASFSGAQFTNEDKMAAYRADVCYSTAKTVGFDFLKSTMAYEVSEQIVFPFESVIVDEADAILIDEARNPLVFAGSMDIETVDLNAVAGFVRDLQTDIHYTTDEYSRNVFLTERGTESAEQHFNCTGLHFEDNRDLLTALNLALQAKVLVKKNIDYIIVDHQIKLVDELTGRLVEDRKWQNGLQSAVEAKEGVPIVSEGKILNSIALQHLICLYEKTCGMTGTAVNASDEFAQLYGIGVYVIPPHRPSQRLDLSDLVFTHREEKLKAIVKEVKTIHQTGRPILIGTLTIKESEELQNVLMAHGVECIVLNAKNDASEAAIIANAGLPNAVTISTNMAGRGTDIILGGIDGRYRDKVVRLGGLHVIGTNRHESLRIDNQLKGRAGRQGDPGSTQFIVSMDDELMKKYGLMSLLPKRFQQIRMEGPISESIINIEIARAQRIIEGQLFEIRKTLCDYTKFTESQRKVHFKERSVMLQEMTSENDSFTKFMLFQYDFHWSEFLSEVDRIREGIAWERMAGRNPLREFFTHCDLLYKQMQEQLTDLKGRVVHQRMEDLLIKRPSSTWTYVINDSPTNNPLASMLMDGSNIGYQFDLLAGPLLIFSHWFSKRKGK